jgi:hopanoid-associated phosphorylase
VTIIAVCGLLREARIAAGPGVKTAVAANDPDLLRRKLEQAIAEGARGIVSFGIAGGLEPSLKSGDCVVAWAVQDGGARFIPDVAWAQRIVARLPHAIHAPVAGVDGIAATPAAKSALFESTRAYAVDMESHIVARVAVAHRVPFAVLRTIADPAHSALPPLASAAVTAAGRLNLLGVLASLLGNPRQISALPRTARETNAAFAALLRCRRALGVGFLGPDGGELPLDMG